MKILVTGSTGQVGWELARALRPVGEVVAPGRDELDLARPETIRAAVASARPDLVVNAAGYTSVDLAESEPLLADAVNAAGPALLAEAAAEAGAALVHYSTDYVFDGAADRPYLPTDPTGPVNAYGRSKLAGERGILAAAASALVLRTSWVYSTRRRNFLLTMIEKARTGAPLRVVNDQHGCPTPARLIATVTARLAGDALERRDGAWSFGERSGVHHLVCRGSATWFEFARAIFDQLGIDPPPEIVPITSDAYPTAALRPRYSVLDAGGFEAAFGLDLPDWRDALACVLAEDDVPVPLTTVDHAKETS